jgi:anti-sigma-K factor RskA
MLPSRTNLHALAAVYALDALDDGAEQRRFTRHLRHCQACAEEVRGFRDVAAALAFAAATEPPPELREQVMAAVARTRQLPPVTSRRRLPDWLTWTPQSVWLPRLATATAAVAIAAVVALSVALSGTTQQLNSARAQGQAIAAVLAAPDVRTVTGPVSTGGTTTVLVSAGKRELVVSTSGLAALPTGKTYQLWLIGPSSTQATAVRPAGLLPPAVSGLATPPVLASGLVAGDKLGMTVEPAGGSNQPTTTPILLLSLPART